MDIIDKAIERGRHLSTRNDLNEQMWETFEREASDKKVILFGSGMSAGCYFSRYGDSVKLAGIVDNDSMKQGFRIEEIVPEAFHLESGKEKIKDVTLLDSYQTNEIVVLITSINYYEQIAEQLEQKGIRNYFVLLIMEANRKKLSAKQKKMETDDSIYKIKFAEECCEREKLERKKIFFKAYADYADHGKYITEALLKLRKDLDIVWAVDNLKAEVPEGIRKIYERNWKSLIYEMETSAVWVLDLAVPDYIIKRRGQIYLQTKHWASITLKKFYLDVASFREAPELIRVWKREKELIDYIITGSDFDTESCRRGFEYEGEVLQYGSPRSDALFCEKKNREKIYAYYHMKKGSYALLYAPTYRFDKEKNDNYAVQLQIELDFCAIKKVLEQRFGGEWYILVRLHPSVAAAFDKVERPDFVIDASLYTDSQELVSATDIMISDFSSIMFEAAFGKKPVFLFVTDLQDYIVNENELLIPYRDLPFPIFESNMELERGIANFDMVEYQRKVAMFLQKYGVHEDGHASKRVAEFISNAIS